MLPTWAIVLIVLLGCSLSSILGVFIARLLAPLFTAKIQREYRIEKKLNDIEEWIKEINYREKFVIKKD